jgi:prepilin-type N-terminal cleavage/methylation domain-containing protein
MNVKKNTISAHSTKGFTLIELSIVLVIIGLIVGSVLVGRELIHAAEIRKTITQREQFETAVHTFRAKFNCLPGDCATAAELGLSTGDFSKVGAAGTGDGIINYDGITSNEFANFWYHLYKTDLVSLGENPISPALPDTGSIGTACEYGGYSSSPCLPFSSPSSDGKKAGWSILYGGSSSCVFPYFNYSLSRNHYWWIASGIGPDSSGVSTVLIPVDAYAIDKKIDDGLPFAGNTLAAGDNDFNLCGAVEASPGPGGVANNICVNNATSPYTYNILNTKRNSGNLCGLFIKTTF